MVGKGRTGRKERRKKSSLKRGREERGAGAKIAKQPRTRPGVPISFGEWGGVDTTILPVGGSTPRKRRREWGKAFWHGKAGQAQTGEGTGSGFEREGKNPRSRSLKRNT